MSDSISDGGTTTQIGDKTHSLTGHDSGNLNSAVGSLISPVMSEDVARQIKAATGPLTKQLERLCYLMKELRQTLAKCNEKTGSLI